MGKEKKEKEQFLSNRLYQLIYKPELPPNWREMSVNNKLYMFKNCFLLLNEDFQKEYGELLEKWLNYIEYLYSDIEDDRKLNDFFGNDIEIRR